MKLLKLPALAALIAVGLTGCSATPEECDPHQQQSLFTKMACANGGGYDQRINNKEAELANAESENSASRQTYSKVKAQQQAASAKVSSTKAQVAKSKATTASLKSQVSKKQQTKQQVDQQISQLQKQIGTVQNSGKSDAEKQAEIQRLQQKVNALKQTATDL
ncbi:hypothetical protein [Lonepinella sp. BR2474]|uniref:hypothetical protein n=1 Tax=Lonepinella sp. BR2474 TaxID=3434548 RepID=UPI003F6E14B1